ncbi:olfactory receptor 6C75-like [Gastrophryne carolinensis]
MGGNITAVTEFIFLPFINLHPFQHLMFALVLNMYIICVTGNIIIIFLIKKDSSLHSPMYLFIGTFSLLEIIFVSIIIPNFLDILSGNNHISFLSCFAQQCTADTMGVVENFLLAVMAFDRDLAVNSPLYYSNIMSRLSFRLAVLPWILGFVIISIPTILTSQLDFCGPNELDHFFCDLAPLQTLACSDSFVSNMAISCVTVIGAMFPFIAIIGFYSHIIVTIINIKSVEGKRKAFSTCSSHIIVASMYYATVITVYINPNHGHNDKFLALLYTVVVPTLNPFIYTLRNKDVKRAFFKTVQNISNQLRKRD